MNDDKFKYSSLLKSLNAFNIEVTLAPWKPARLNDFNVERLNPNDENAMICMLSMNASIDHVSSTVNGSNAEAGLLNAEMLLRMNVLSDAFDLVTSFRNVSMVAVKLPVKADILNTSS